MAGVTDLVFRNLCRENGADFAVSEMVASKTELRESIKSSTRHANKQESSPRIVQLIGTDPDELLEAALWQASQGAEVIDLNMGCPAKKVCSIAAGSALMSHPALVEKIFSTLSKSVDLPITVKIRTGADLENRNALKIAKLAEQCGLSGISIHGRTRADKFQGHAEYETIRQVKQAVKIPVFANGDISSPEKALFVLKYTGADGLLIGRSAQGNPWLFREIQQFLATGEQINKPSFAEFKSVILQHLQGLYKLYGERQGPRIARKHLGWYAKNLPCELTDPLDFPGTALSLRQKFNQLETPLAQTTLIKDYFQSYE